MVVIKYCDKCKSEIKDKSFIKWISRPSYNFVIEGYEEVTLCNKCKKKFDNFMKE